VSSSELSKFRFKNDKSEEFANEFGVFNEILWELRDYMKYMDLKLIIASNILNYALEDFDRFYYSLMCIPDDKMRMRSWRNVKKWIYQLWVLKTTCECLSILKLYKITFGKEHEYLDLEIRGFLKQGSARPICAGNSPYGDFTFWF